MALKKIKVALLASATVASMVAVGVTTSSVAASGATKVNWAKVTHLTSSGPTSMKALIKAAKAEGTLNVVALPANWANYGTIIHDFSKKYGIKVNSENPDGSSAEEIAALKSDKGRSSDPDVIDVGTSYAVTAQSEGLLAPYKVQTWNDIPAPLKSPKGYWFDDYGGYVAIGYTATKVKNPPKSFADLLKPAYKNEVGINTTPTEAGAAFAAVLAASIANKGSLGNIAPGVAYFKKLAAAGNFVPTKADPATVENGTTPIVIWWDYLEASEVATKLPDWKTVIPSDGSYAAFYTQAINKTAPHPAAARLWEEFLYSKEGQNGFLNGAAQPIEMQAMIKKKTITKKAEKLLPPMPSGTLKLATPAELTKDATVLAHTWSTKVTS